MQSFMKDFVPLQHPDISVFGLLVQKKTKKCSNTGRAGTLLVAPSPLGLFNGWCSRQLWDQAPVARWTPISLIPAPSLRAWGLVGPPSWQQGPGHPAVGSAGKGWGCSAIPRASKGLAHSSTPSFPAPPPQYWGTITAANWPIKPKE